MKSLNFEILRANWSNLATYCTYAENYLYSDPQSSVLKLRCFIEELVNYLYKELDLNLDTNWDLFKALKNELFENTIDSNIVKKMHAIRIKANKAIHKNHISLDDAKWLLEEAFNISNWFYCTYANEIFQINTFVLPKPIEDNINHLEETIRELERIIDTKNTNKIIEQFGNSEKINLFKNKNIEISQNLGLNSLEVDKRITINEIFSSYKLNDGQMNLVNNLEDFLDKKDFNIFLLKGYAGTGKTFIAKGLTEYLTTIRRKFILAAPTGKAAKVIKEKTKNEAFTIHKTIYSYNDLKEYKVENDGTETFKFYFDLNDNTHDANTVYIIDEASMIGNVNQEGEFFRFGSGKLLSDLMKYIHIDQNDHNKKIIFIGDNAQLPPIGMNFSPALSSEYFEKEFNLKCKSFELTEVMRQSSKSGIVENSLIIRESIRKNTFNQLDINLVFEDLMHVEHNDVLSQYIKSCDEKINAKSIIIAHSNAVVDEYNSQVRKHFFPNQNFITVGDKVMAVANNGNYPIFIYNGDFGLIKEVDTDIIKREVFIKERINEKLLTMRLPLWFRKVKIGFKNIENNKSCFFECLIFENLLYRDFVYQDEINKYELKEQDIARLETVALYVDFVNRAREKGLKPNTAEFKQTIKTDIFFNALKIKFGYALTCHKAQGSEWDNVFVNCKTHQNVLTKDYFRWFYTAITRASKKLYLMDEPHVTIMNGFENLQPLSKNIIKFIEEKVAEVCEILGINIDNIQHPQYHEIYTFSQNEKTQRIQIYYNGQNKITRISSIDNDVLINLIDKLKESLLDLVIYGDNHHNINSNFTFTETFLEEFYKALKEKMERKEILIINIKHISYCERYTFKKEEKIAVIDFWYNGKKQFKKAPQAQKDCSIELVNEIYEALK
ncbi:RecD-like DNA helicase (AAA domain) [Arcobacter acticola]|uniref:RecD-like DNA helicase (AAA domain) n=1 Tax=Arcobacter acticola TaxID=1849015 RepID=A0A6M8EUZ2_9BACT|nr:AAA family ATPase [Arcobacter acticola]QKE28345.1 RecD-like DNA helicase (AAA domain) [Arcobacter acticola]